MDTHVAANTVRVNQQLNNGSQLVRSLPRKSAATRALERAPACLGQNQPSTAEDADRHPTMQHQSAICRFPTMRIPRRRP